MEWLRTPRSFVGTSHNWFVIVCSHVKGQNPFTLCLLYPSSSLFRRRKQGSDLLSRFFYCPAVLCHGGISVDYWTLVGSTWRVKYPSSWQAYWSYLVFEVLSDCFSKLVPLYMVWYNWGTFLPRDHRWCPVTHSFSSFGEDIQSEVFVFSVSSDTAVHVQLQWSVVSTRHQTRWRFRLLSKLSWMDLFWSRTTICVRCIVPLQRLTLLVDSSTSFLWWSTTSSWMNIVYFLVKFSIMIILF